MSLLDERLDSVRKTSGLDAASLEKLRKLVADGEDRELFRTNPYRVSKLTGLPEDTALELLLHGTHAGIFEFAWGVLCPVCSAFITTPAGLRSVRQDGHCKLCEIPYAADADTGVEVAFSLAPTVRRLRYADPEKLPVHEWMPLVFSPSVAHTMMFQKRIDDAGLHGMHVPVGETASKTLELGPGAYDVLAVHHHSVARFEVEGDGPREVELELTEAGLMPSFSRVGAGAVTVRVKNRTGTKTPLGIRRDPRPPPGPAREALLASLNGGPVIPRDPYLTAKRVLTSQTFRDLFRAESLPSEAGLEFKSLTLLFTDLKGSTEMYERIGDFRAYALVREHFGVLRRIVAARGGSLVKTIGDAIMASFPEPAPAMAAAAEMNREMRKVGAGEDLLLKIGLHTGPCIAVDSNERLDYFGQTVNIAARVQGIADAQEIVVTESAFGLPGVGEVARAAGLASRRDTAALKGIEGRTGVVRLREVA